MALLQVAHNYEEQGMNVVLFTSDLDNRFGHANIASRLGVMRKGLTYTRWTNFYERLKGGIELFLDDNQVVDDEMRDFLTTTAKPIACVLIDEAQFLDPEQVRQLHKLAHIADIPVICYGLRSDFLGEPFPGAAYLLTLADDIEELKNICACGRKATMNVRIDERGGRITEGEQVAIEGSVRYVQTCGRCFYEEGFRP
jgi:thymidine kinase